jgi:hypothetical protein
MNPSSHKDLNTLIDFITRTYGSQLLYEALKRAGSNAVVDELQGGGETWYCYCGEKVHIELSTLHGPREVRKVKCHQCGYLLTTHNLRKLKDRHAEAISGAAAGIGHSLGAAEMEFSLQCATDILSTFGVTREDLELRTDELAKDCPALEPEKEAEQQKVNFREFL